MKTAVTPRKGQCTGLAALLAALYLHSITVTRSKYIFLASILATFHFLPFLSLSIFSKRLLEIFFFFIYSLFDLLKIIIFILRNYSIAMNEMEEEK